MKNFAIDNLVGLSVKFETYREEVDCAERVRLVIVWVYWLWNGAFNDGRDCEWIVQFCLSRFQRVLSVGWLGVFRFVPSNVDVGLASHAWHAEERTVNTKIGFYEKYSL